MVVETTIARHFAWRCIFVVLVCLVMGLWGVYDYVYAIPSREMAVHRGNICMQVKTALEPGGWDTTAEEARTLVAAEIQRLQTEHFKAKTVPIDAGDAEKLAAREAEFREAIESIRERNEESWLVALMLFQSALNQGRPIDYPLTGVQLLAHDIADRGAQAVATVKKPSTYDRPTQWAFIACLPFVPYYLWVLFATRAKKYRLDEDGTLHTPEGALKRDEIADIDMSRWMKKSIAYVVDSSGRRIMLDDYKHRNLHLIIGAIASRLYPDQWHADAKPVKKDEEAVEEVAAAETTQSNETT